MFHIYYLKLFNGVIFWLLCCRILHGAQNNICSYYNGKPVCCPGWYNGLGKSCSIPVCDGNCGDRGECIKPNTCICADRRLRFSCTKDEDYDIMQRDQADDHCPNNCNGQGDCKFGKCVCRRGFTGPACETALESPCYTSLKRGLCIRPMQDSYNNTVKVNREVCCNTFGIAWGKPCSPCDASYCGRGYQNVAGICLDINECEIPGVCPRGQCVNREGSYFCKCPNGYEFDHELLDCVIAPEKPCEKNRHLCSPGGQCINLPNGAYKCNCNWGWTLALDKKSCQAEKQFEFNICQIYKQSVCKNGQCIPRGSSYECRCNEGFEPSEDRKSCQYKVDICSLHRGYLCSNGQCVPDGRTFYCICNPGFTLSFDRQRCISRCEEAGANICANGQCIVKPNGDYECQCYAGYHNYPNPKQCTLKFQEDTNQNRIAIKKPPHYYKYDYKQNQINYENPVEIISVRGNSELTKWRDLPDYWQGDSNTRQKTIIKNVEAPYRPFTNYLSQKHQNNKRYTENPRDRNKPPCLRQEILEKCNGGLCLNMGGDAYICECNSGYQATEDQRACYEISGEQLNVENWQNDHGISKGTKLSETPKQGSSVMQPMQDFRRHPCRRQSILSKCQGGFCLNLGGEAYMCECLPGYQTMHNGKSCMKKSDKSNIEHSRCPTCLYGCLDTLNEKNSCICKEPSNWKPLIGTGLCTHAERVRFAKIQTRSTKKLLILQIPANASTKNLINQQKWTELMKKYVDIIQQDSLHIRFEYCRTNHEISINEMQITFLEIICPIGT